MESPSKFEVARRKLGRLSVQERVLLRLSKHPREVDRTAHYKKPESVFKGPDTLRGLRENFRDFDALIRDKDVLDFGCGDGFQAVAMQEAGARSVHGVDISAQRVENARNLAQDNPAVTFAQHLRDERFDVIVSQDAFEHLDDPRASLDQLRRALRPGGRILLHFGPPWLSAYGAHMHFFSSMPWMNVLFSERTVMRIRSLYRDDGRTTYDDGLNRMTIRRFEQIIRDSGLEIVSCSFSSPKGTGWVRGVPGVREFFISHVAAILVPRDSG